MKDIKAHKKIVFLVLFIFGIKFNIAEGDSQIVFKTHLGLRNYKVGKYKKAYEYFFDSAKKGNKEAQYYLGCMLLKGEGIEKNFIRAFKWLSIAAEQGHLKALNVIGVIYKNGTETHKNLDEARKFFQLSADKNLNVGQFNLGVLLFERYKAKRKNASHELETKEHDGHGKVENYREDLVEGYKWLKISELNGFERAAKVLKILQSEILPSEIVDIENQAEVFSKKFKN